MVVLSSCSLNKLIVYHSSLISVSPTSYMCGAGGRCLVTACGIPATHKLHVHVPYPKSAESNQQVPPATSNGFQHIVI